MLQQVVGEILGHALGEGGDEHALVLVRALTDLPDEVVDLPLRRAHLHLRVHQAGRANHLLHELALRRGDLVIARGGGHVHALALAVVKLLPGQRPVIQRTRQAETVLDQVALAGHVALEHAADLRHRHVGLVDDGEEVLREVVDQRRRGTAGGSAVDVSGVVLDAAGEAHLLDHLEVVFRAHPQSLRLQQLAAVLQVLQALRQLVPDGLHRLLHPLRPSDVVGGREDAQFIHLADHVAGQRVDVVERVDVVPEELDADGELLVCGDDVHRVPLHAEGTAGEGDVVAVVLDVHEQAEELVAVDFLVHPKDDGAVQVGLRGTQAVDAGDRADDNHVAA